ncbi:MAG: hypothetical protein ICCCNLDF_01033 [Planctomycetes bacterium]|nr:hypothetical protein [Planctomycetota bacterium]
MRYLVCTALLALLAVTGCDRGTGASSASSGSAASAPLTITTTVIPDFTVPGVPGSTMPSYTATISATGGTGSYSWSIVAGALPAGLSIAPTGTPDTTITGTMTSPVTTSFTVQVTDSAAATATRAYTLVVTYAPTPPPGSTTPVYFGQPLAGRMLFICDMSAATAGQPLANLQTELTAALNSLTGSEQFDILVYNEAISGFVSALWGTPQQATTSNVTAAVNWVNGPSFTAAGGVDYACYTALQTSFTSYTSIDTAFLYTWSTPGDGSAILADYPNWATSDPNRQLTVICKGGSAQTFAQQLAALAGGTYVP